MTWTYAGGEPEPVSATVQESSGRLLGQELAHAVLHSEHYWTAVVMFRVAVPMAEGTLLDHESIRGVPAVGCYICEQPYRPGMEHRRCRGEPR